MVRNLRDYLVQGTSAVLTGGPKMGKTTLLKQTAEALSAGPAPVWADLSNGPPADSKWPLPKEPDPFILLLDGCEGLLPNPIPFLRTIQERSRKWGKRLRGAVWCGGVSWGEWAMAHRSSFDRPLRYYPLVVLPPKEARPFLRQHLPKETTSSEIEGFLEAAGGHPYLLSNLLRPLEGDTDAFFSGLWDAAGSPDERAVLTQLIENGSWILLADLKTVSGGKIPKRVLDRLAILGLITRTLVDGSAAAKAVSPLLGEWAARTRLIFR
ncbi:MAG TPA: hypothetical protein VI702_03360 [Nitrospiria bacterium]